MEKGNYEINDWTINLLKIKGGEEILEIGIGNGSILNKISRRNMNGRNIGIDISKDMIKEAKKYNEKLINNGVVDIQEAGIESLPFDGEYVDKLFTVHTIYFWKSMDQGFHKSYRVLKPGGMLYVSIMNKSTMQKMKRRIYSTLSDIFINIHEKSMDIK
ncbi:class I SAM-dependent methyltransferase [Lentibacillus sp. CBA3610]|uniref:class I SAM-dependent methyltransferase n=1 Tax=Lentibacillus sp. CBA3610 TaxID=2518176 RepID=UPI0020D22DCF|nr:class I SAM-dependent methyltransferase [Lentibacillus sp. CBA3610]